MTGLQNIRNISSTKGVNVVGIVIILIVLLYVGFYIRKTIATVYFHDAIKHISEESLDVGRAHAHVKKAVKIEPYDSHYQVLAQVALIDARMKLQNATQADTATIEVIKSDIDESIKAVKAAVAADPSNFYNYVIEARISSALVPLNVPDAFDNAVRSYADAIVKNPTSPSLYLEAAKFLADSGKYTEAKATLGKALTIKNNFHEAIFLLSQIQAAEGSLVEAINSVTMLTQANPQAQFLFFQLGYLKYSNKDYTGAIEALNKAIAIDNQYANARYFLGLSLSKLGKVSEAIKQFELVQTSNPDNAEVQAILKNLRAGKAPFAGMPSADASIPIRSDGKNPVQRP